MTADVVLAEFTREHLERALVLFAAEDWPSYSTDAEQTWRALTAAGSMTVVAVEGDEVVGVAQIQSDGEIQAHLSTLVVAATHRRRGIARRLLAEALRRAGGKRIDLISRTEDFYPGLGARRFHGFRIVREDLGLD
jgi:ribosomal protein S18 acetylase RimI-like enzyme